MSSRNSPKANIHVIPEFAAGRYPVVIPEFAKGEYPGSNQILEAQGIARRVGFRVVIEIRVHVFAFF